MWEVFMNHENDEILESVIAIVKQATRSEDVDKSSSTENFPKWDSLAYMSVVGEVEIKFGIEITEMNINDFNSIEAIVDIVKKSKID